MLRYAWVIAVMLLAAAALPRTAVAADLPSALAEELVSGVAAAGNDDEIQALSVLERFYRERDYRPL